jgi:hypothetical protein
MNKNHTHLDQYIMPELYIGIHCLYDIKKNPYINVNSSSMTKMIKSKKHNLYNRVIDPRGGKYTGRYAYIYIYI